MKTPNSASWRWLIALLAGAGVSFQTLAQELWMPIGPPSWTNTSIVSVGGITYFTGTAYLRACHRIEAGLLRRAGSNLVQTANEELWTGFCVACATCYYNETNVSVLGALPPGQYLLSILSNSPFGGPPVPYVQIPFSVSVSQTPAVSSWADTSEGRFHLNVDGIPGASYVIQASEDASHWSSLVTNIGAPFAWSEQLSPQTGNRFYRAWIIGH